MQMKQLELNLIDTEKKVKQRTDYTFKYNRKIGRHGWLRLTPAYSVKLVHEILMSAESKGIVIFDPFSGTGTTPLVASEKGFKSYATDINPFLIWFGRTKISDFTAKELVECKEVFNLILENYKEHLEGDNWLPAIFNIDRWWAKDTLKFLSAVRKTIVEYCNEPQESQLSHNVIWIVFCRLVIETSSAAFNHVSMSFKENAPSINIATLENLLSNIFDHIHSSSSINLDNQAKILYGDARETPSVKDVKFDMVITSPPYPNRMSYIRELRPYMYWTKFLVEAKQAGEIDWKAIGGTWGTATSKLKHWQPISDNLPSTLIEVCDKISDAENKNGELMKLYVLKYFDDLNLHIKNIRPSLSNGAKLSYIIGNSNFYNNCVEAEKILIEIFDNWGFSNTSAKIIRKRNSNKNLFEYQVDAVY